MTTRSETRKKNYRIKRRKRIIKTLRFIIIVGAVYALIFCTPFFNIKSIEVEGNAVTSAQSVISASGISKGKHILKVDKRSAEEGIEKLAYVKEATIKRSFPGKINIIITEGKVCANIALPKGFAAIAETGKVMEITDSPKTLPAVYGLNVKKSEVGEKITIDEMGQLDVILEYRDKLSRQALPFNYVSITKKLDSYSIEFENGIIVFFGDKNDIEYKVAAFAESIRSAGDIKSGYFDVSVPERIVYSTTAPQEEKAEQTQQPDALDEPGQPQE